MTITRPDFMRDARLDRETLALWIDSEWIIPTTELDVVTFSEKDLARAGLIQDLKLDFGVNGEGISVILHLLDQMHGLRRALAESLEAKRPTR